MAFKFTDLMTEEQKVKLANRNEMYAKRRREIKDLTNENLASTCKYYMAQMRSLSHWNPGDPVYDASFWYIIIPEMIKRLEK